MSLTLDGSTRIVATEYVLLTATGSTNLATENYVDTAIINGGGGGGVNLSNYYQKSEVDTLLDKSADRYTTE